MEKLPRQTWNHKKVKSDETETIELGIFVNYESYLLSVILKIGD